MVEIISFGTLSKLIKNLKTGPDGVYAKLAENYKYISIKGNMVKPSQKMLTSRLGETFEYLKLDYA